MSEVTDYIMANYVWFVVGSVIIIMAIIGYFADKKGFGKPKPKDKEKDQVKVDESKDKEENKENKDLEDKEKVEPVVTEPIVSNPVVQDEVYPVEPIVEVPAVDEPTLEQPVVEETVPVEPIAEEAPAIEPIAQEENVSEVTPVEPITEPESNDLSFENSDNQVPVIESLSSDTEDKPISFDAGNVPEVETSEIKDNNTSFDEEPNAFMPTDDLTSINDNLTDEEDIWKF